MIGFWIAAAALSAACAMLIIYLAARARGGGPPNPARTVYARQLDEIDDMAARGLIAEPERQSARAEAARRLIGAGDGVADTVADDRGVARKVVVGVAAAAPLLALACYLLVGSPTRPDQPFAARVAAWRRADPATLDAPRMSALLEQLTRERPKDARLLIFLARAEAAQGQDALAVRTLERAARLAPDQADIWGAIGEALSDLAGGQVTADARAAFEHSLRIDPKAPLARYRLAGADIAEGKVVQGLAVWRAISAELPAGDPRRAALDAEIAQVARTGRAPAPAPAAAPEPAAGAAGEQRAFIQSMVDGLAARLKAQPDDPSGWARLIHAYGVLGEEDRRQAAIAEVERRYASRPALMRSILNPP